MVRSGVCGLVQQLGYRVLEAPSAAIAFETWRQHRDAIALVVTDLQMPGGMSGIDLARAIRAERPAMPVVFSSGYAEQFADQEPLIEGENFLAKPYTPAKLAQLLRARLDLARARQTTTP